jgi:hypothetical protein
MISMTRFDSTPMHRARVVLLTSAIVLVSSCGGGGSDSGITPTQPPTEPPIQPTVPSVVPGTLTVRLVTPYTDDGAILLDIAGPAPAAEIVAAAQGAVVNSRSNGNTTRVAVFGSLGSGALVRFSVPDVNVAQQFSAQVTEVSDRASALRASVTGYQITIAP